ncbi:MAG TPA: invasion associated locus B family protein [Xanthobacteraceae bacterium]|nr:invasion associated locus B family protein [Xanthobacteraceae bacterium]
MYPNRVFGWLVATALIAAPLTTVSAQTPPAAPPPAKRPPAAPKDTAPREAPPKEAPRAAPSPATTPSPNAPTAGGIEEGPSATTAVYGDWVVRCSQQAATRTCEAAQTIFAQGQQNPIALVAIGREKQGAPLRLVVQLPLNVTVPAQVKITLAPADPPLELTFEHCIPSSCFAMIQSADNAVRRLRAHPDAARISYKDASDKDVAFQFSLRGLASALDALAKT